MPQYVDGVLLIIPPSNEDSAWELNQNLIILKMPSFLNSLLPLELQQPSPNSGKKRRPQRISQVRNKRPSPEPPLLDELDKLLHN